MLTCAMVHLGVACKTSSVSNALYVMPTFRGTLVDAMLSTLVEGSDAL